MSLSFTGWAFWAMFPGLVASCGMMSAPIVGFPGLYPVKGKIPLFKMDK
jgi:hypothetical protein